jgi:acyl-[acyl-carrier-protein]-phospholipid O-acyltransferase/long-chain-fatty-acid--[acyl-carrier-protein] ligase
MVLVEELLKAIPKATVLWQFALTLLLPPRWRDQGRPHDVAALVFSSGSTGDPKGVQLTHAQILANNESIRRALDVGAGDVVLTPLPLFHSFGLVPGMWLGLESGFAIAAHPDPMDAKGLGELAGKAGATFSITTATFVRGWMRRIEPDKLKSLRFAVAGAEKCPKELRDAFKAKYGADLLEGYGCTELAPAVCFNMQTVVSHGETEVRTRDGTVGRALPGQQVVATDRETRALLPTGQEGLLVVRTPARMLGYLNRDDLTRKAFIHGGYDTGDIGVVDADGYVRITGRLARFAKIGGEMVPLDSVEAALQAPHADRCEIAVAAEADADRGERLVVLVAGEDPPKPEEIIAGAADLGALWRPKAKDVHRVDALPRLGTGKRDLAGVKRLAAEKAG